jgi:hypothetical protein
MYLTLKGSNVYSPGLQPRVTRGAASRAGHELSIRCAITRHEMYARDLCIDPGVGPAPKRGQATARARNSSRVSDRSENPAAASGMCEWARSCNEERGPSEKTCAEVISGRGNAMLSSPVPSNLLSKKPLRLRGEKTHNPQLETPNPRLATRNPKLLSLASPGKIL